MVASVGRAEVQCACRPRVTVLTTGDELQEPGEPLRPGAVRNSNAHSVAALVERAGAELVELLEIVPDDRAATEAALERALVADVAVICGGVSVGEHDHVRPALAALGVEQVFWGVALRPGKPTCFGVASAGACWSSASRATRSRRWSPSCSSPGRRSGRCSGIAGGARGRPRSSTHDYPKQPGRAHLVRCRLELRDDGWHARPTGPQGSHVLTSMLGADALAIMPTASGGVAAGERVEIELLALTDLRSREMEVEVRLFAILRERAGRERIALDLSEGATVADALAAAAQEPGLDEVLADDAGPRGRSTASTSPTTPRSRTATRWR